MSYNSLITSHAPTHRWKLDETSGSLVDAGSGSETLTATGLTYAQDPAIAEGTAITFAGASGYAMASGALFGSGAITVGCWFKYTHDGNLHRMMTQFVAGSDQWSLYGGSASEQTIFRVGATNLIAADTHGDGEWHFAVFTRDGSNSCSFYVDGTLQAGPTTIAGAPAGGTFRLGYTSTQGLDGELDEAFIINGTALSAGQVSALFAARLATDGFNLSGGLVNSLTYNLSDGLDIIPEQELLR